MNVLKVVKDEGLHWVYAEHNGMKVRYLLEYSYSDRFQEEVASFRKTFFDMKEVDWSDVMNNEDIKDIFSEYDFLLSTDNERVQ